MSAYRWLIVCACMISTLSGSTIILAAEQVAVEWHESLSKGIERSRQLNRPLLVYIQTEKCGYCRKMDRNTWKTPELSEFMHEHIVAVKLDGMNNRKLMDQWEVEGFPAVRVFSTKGKGLLSLDGYQSSKSLLQKLRASLDKP